MYAGQIVQKDTVRDSIKSFVKIQKYPHPLAFMVKQVFQTQIDYQC